MDAEDLLTAAQVAALWGCAESTVHRRFGKDLPLAATSPKRARVRDAQALIPEVRRTYRSRAPSGHSEPMDAQLQTEVGQSNVHHKVDQRLSALTAERDRLRRDRDRWKNLAASYRLALREAHVSVTHARADAAAASRQAIHLLDSEEASSWANEFD